MALYDDVNNIPKGSIGDEAIVRSATIKNIAFYKENLDEQYCRMIKTTCVINLDVQAIDYGVSGEMNTISTIGSHIVHVNDYDKDYEKNVAFSKALEQVQNFKIVLLATDSNPIDITETDEHGNVISKISFVLSEPLRSLPNGVCDTLEFSEGKAVITRNCGEVVLDGSEDENWQIGSSITSGGLYRYYPYGVDTNCKNGTKLSGLCDRLPYTTEYWHEQTYESFQIGQSNNMIYIYSTVSTISELQSKLSVEPITIVYPLETTTTEIIDLEGTLTLYRGGNVTVDSEILPISGTTHFSKNGDIDVSLDNVGNTFNVGEDKDGNKYKFVEGKGMDMDGQTLVNAFRLNEGYSLPWSVSDGATQKIFYWDNSIIKPSTLYTIIFDVTGYTIGESERALLSLCTGLLIGDEVNKDITGNGRYILTFTSGDGTSTQRANFRQAQTFCSDGANFTVNNVILLEGDHTDKPIEYFEGLQSSGEQTEVKLGKNLFDINNMLIESIGTNTFTIKDNKVILDAQEELYGIRWMPNNLKIGRTYTFSCNCNVESNSKGFRLLYTDGTYSNTTLSTSQIITVTKEIKYVQLYIGMPYTGNKEVTLSNIQIEEGAEATEFEEFKGGIVDRYNIDVLSVGKNLFDINDVKLQYNNLQYQVNDRILTYKGSGTYTFEYLVYEVTVKPNTNYILHVNGSSTASDGNYRLIVYDKEIKKFINGITSSGANDIQFSTTENVVKILFYASWGTANTVEYTVYDIQVRESTESEQYEPYKESKATLSIVEPLRSLPNGVADTAELKGNKLVVTRNTVQVTLNGSEDWSNNTGDVGDRTNTLQFFSTCLDNLNISSMPVKGGKLICDAYNEEGVYNNDVVGIAIVGAVNSKHRLRIGDTSTSTSEFKAKLAENNVNIVAQLDTPTIEEYDLTTPELFEDGYVFISSGAIPISATTHELVVSPPDSEINNVGNYFEVGFDSEGTEYYMEEESNAHLIVKGNTLVNLWGNKASDFNLGYYSSFSDGLITVTPPENAYSWGASKRIEMFKPSTTYTIIYNILSNTIDGTFYINIQNSGESVFKDNIAISKGEIGIKSYLLTSISDLSACIYGLRSIGMKYNTTGSITFQCIILEGDHTNENISYFEGLASTSGTIDIKSVKPTLDATQPEVTYLSDDELLEEDGLLEDNTSEEEITE